MRTLIHSVPLVLGLALLALPSCDDEPDPGEPGGEKVCCCDYDYVTAPTREGDHFVCEPGFDLVIGSECDNYLECGHPCSEPCSLDDSGSHDTGP